MKILILLLVALSQAQFWASDAFSIPSLPIPKTPSTGGGLFVAGPWRYGSATFYGEFDALETMGGACGYGNLYAAGYGTATAALSGALFRLGFACGQCFQIKCYGSRFCFPGTSTIITGTNLCPPNYFKPSNNGGWCNPPRQHFDMAKPAFQKIANWVAGYVPVMFRRVPCARSGGMKFRLTGNGWWLLVFITNVGGPGDIKSVSIKGSRTSWITMSRNWGAGYQVFKNLQGQSLSFMVTSYSTGKTVVTYNVAPANWRMGQIYSGYQLM